MIARGFPVAAICFFVSGACGLIYEIAWSRRFYLFLGSELQSIAIVVGTFMGGLALGSYIGGKRADRSRNPLLLYAFLELLIAVLAPLATFAIDLVSPLLSSAYQSSMTMYAFARVFVVALLLLAPASLMGATFPALVKFATAGIGGTGKATGFLYALNCGGAVAGTLITGMFLIQELGLTVTVFIAASLNIAVAATAWIYGRELVVQKPEEKREEVLQVSPQESVPPGVILAVMFLQGFSSMVLQILWTKSIGIHTALTVYAFTSIVAAYILGLSLGSAVGGFIADRTRFLVRVFALIFLISAAAAYWTGRAANLFPQWIFYINSAGGDSPQRTILLHGLVITGIIILPTLCFGACMPMACKIYATSMTNLGASIGKVYVSNTLGAIAGSLASGFFLIPSLGFKWSLFIAVALLSLSVLLLVVTCRLIHVLHLAIGLVGCLVIVTCLFDGNVYRKEFLTSGIYNRNAIEVRKALESDRISVERFLLEQNHTVEFAGFDEHGVVSVHRITNPGSPDILALRINGRNNASTYLDVSTQLLIGHIPLLIHKNPKRAFIVGHGSGMTSGAVMRHDLDRVVCAELSPAVFEASKYFKEWHDSPELNPKFKMVIGDARSFITHTDEKFDVIISEPCNLWISGMAYLYTKEFFELCKNRLAPGGLATIWMHGYNTSPEVFGGIVRTFTEAFPYATIWHSKTFYDYIIVGSAEPYRISARVISEKFKNPAVAGDLSRIHVADERDVLLLMLSDQNTFRPVVASTRLMTDDNPYIEFEAARDILRPVWRNIGTIVPRLIGIVPIDDVPSDFAERRARASAAFYRYTSAIHEKNLYGANEIGKQLNDFYPCEITSQSLEIAVDNLLERADALFRKGDFYAVYEVLGLISEQSKRYFLAQYTRISAVTSAGDYALAMRLANELLEKFPGKFPYMYCELSRLQMNIDPVKARETIDKGIDLLRKDQFPKMTADEREQVMVALTAQLAFLQSRAGEMEKARTNATWVLSKEPDNPFALDVMRR